MGQNVLRKNLPLLAALLVTVIFLALMLSTTAAIPTAGEWYSLDQSLRLQSEAFLRGELAIQPVPYGHRHDWAWGNGAHQCWGLGVPLLQLPFNLLAKGLGGFGFPDRITFLIYYAAVIIVFGKALSPGSRSGLGPLAFLKEELVRIPLLFFIFLNPALIIMLKIKFEPYEEVIAYSYLWSLLLFALLTLFHARRRRDLYLLICLASGFAINLRPTIGAYGVMTFLAAFCLAPRFRFIGAGLYLASLGLYPLANYLRFGSPLEAGFKLVLTASPFSDYVTKFDNTLNWVPFASAARELLSALFFLDLGAYAQSGELPWQIEVPRWREINFKVFDAQEFILLLAAWGLIGLLYLRRQRGKGGLFTPGATMNQWGALWSFGSFILLFCFYTRCPGLSSRYFVDFAPAIEIGIVMLSLTILHWSTGLAKGYSWAISAAIAIALLGWTSLHLLRAEIIDTHAYRNKVELANVTTAEMARTKLQEMRHLTGPPIPAAYHCGDREIGYGIPYNNSEWDISGNCIVMQTSAHFLEDPNCISLHITPFTVVWEQPESDYTEEEIEMRVGIETWPQLSATPVADGGKVITYCSQGKKGYENPRYPRLKLVSIKWFDWRKHPEMQLPPLQLLSLWKSR